MVYEKLKEYWISIILWVILSVWVFTIFVNHNDQQKWIELKTNIWVIVSKWLWEIWKYNKNFTSYALEEWIFNKTFWKYHIKLLNTDKWQVIPILFWWIWDKEWEVLFFEDTTSKNNLEISWLWSSEKTLWNTKLFQMTAEKNELFPFFVTRNTKIVDNQCKYYMKQHSLVNNWKTIIAWIHKKSFTSWDMRSSTISWNCRVETLIVWWNKSWSWCETFCNRSEISPDFFWFVTDWYLWFWYFKTKKEAEDFDKQYFWWNWFVLDIQWEWWKLFFSVLTPIWLI